MNPEEIQPLLFQAIKSKLPADASVVDEIAGLLGLKVKKNIDLKAGWRYLVVDYRNSSNQYLYNVASSGFILGALFNFK